MVLKVVDGKAYRNEVHVKSPTDRYKREYNATERLASAATPAPQTFLKAQTLINPRKVLDQHRGQEQPRLHTFATHNYIRCESSKLSDRILNIELLRHLARLQSDPETSTPTRIFVSAGWDITPNEEFSLPRSARTAGEEYVDDVFVGGYEVGQGSDGWRRMDIFARGYWQVELDVVLRLGREVIESQAATAIIDAGTTFVITSYSIARSYYPNVSGATAHTEGADACWTTKLLILSTIFNFVDVCICAVPFPHSVRLTLTGNTAKIVAERYAKFWVFLEEKGIPCQYKEFNPHGKEKHFLRTWLTPMPDIACSSHERRYQPKKTSPPRLSTGRERLYTSRSSCSPHPLHARNSMMRRESSQQVKGLYFSGKEFGLVDVVIAPWVAREYILAKCRHNKTQVGDGWSEYKREKKNSVLVGKIVNYETCIPRNWVYRFRPGDLFIRVHPNPTILE
ncbi:hypothetical protein EV424DRAFT_1341554 [Suillus variegatus]|nr:hypothetical protein EV424DRAFT_1341554 [Suillus variegatus]